MAGTVLKEKKEPPKKADAFDSFVGHDRSLAPIIKQAKAAMMYPPRGLHTLILGETGVGKSDLATAMFRFSRDIGYLDKDAEFIVFNCADYAENPELLMSQIFGYKKGAFTGANQDKPGLVEKADRSILFLDEVHRLPPEGQEQLFYLIDKGKFRRLGETSSDRSASLTIIAATTENPELTLLDTFRRRIPMVIAMPALAERPMREKLDIIKIFVQQEALRISRTIIVSNDALKSLLLFECPGNLGQLKSEIQVACARGFMNVVVGEREEMELTMDDLSTPTKRGLLQMKYYREEMDQIVGHEAIIITPGYTQTISSIKSNLYIMPDEIYAFIEERYGELNGRYDNQEIVNYILGNEIEKKLIHFVKRVDGSKKRLSKEELVNIFGLEILGIVDKVIQHIEKKYRLDLEGLYYILAAHLSATFERVRGGKALINPQLAKIKKEYVKEFQMSLEITDIIEREMGVSLPEDEAGFITMYLRMIIEGIEEEREGCVGVIVASHGSVAEGMAAVANRLLGVNHAKFMEMALDEKPQHALERTQALVQKAEMGKGVLLLVDMGSLVSFGDIITEKTGIPTRTITRTDTVLAIDAVRRAILPESNLDDIADGLLSMSKNPLEPESQRKGQKILLTVCITGHGGAVRIVDILESLLGDEATQYKIMPMGLFDKQLEDTIRDLKRNNEVLGIVGSINPQVPGIPFVHINELSSGEGLTKVRAIIGGSAKRLERWRETPKSLGLKDLVQTRFLACAQRVSTKKAAIQELVSGLEAAEMVSPIFRDTVFEREDLSSTYFRDGIAIPHGLPEAVNRPGLNILKLKEPVDWDGRPVWLVVLMAVDSQCLGAIGEFYDFFDGTDRAEALRNAENPEELFAIFKNCDRTIGGKVNGK
ncbi:Transcriptional regulatory protein LevR, contains PRD, AAA+ and EIIA domains [Eubacterium aggregans]|uniref:Transcriptional regulatory protein LevR, contains PRD, AAA+ and EIIA domains n=1 Tax=Eubacterium aggregans TaxID=81409 RepID=A0A1H4AZE7_9FIRM|nr:sigma 54-interacting transcriptional regulator [Eubacterium aggregans]SEA41239.1 Transcriptional regulatory protein LevR, contains PRD, AAA+ and EIIA domains [Eubacterium aggregans]